MPQIPNPFATPPKTPLEELKDIFKNGTRDDLRRLLDRDVVIPGFEYAIVLASLRCDFIRIILDSRRFRRLNSKEQMRILKDIAHVAGENFALPTFELFLKHKLFSRAGSTHWLNYAAKHGNIEMIKLLLKYKSCDTYDAIITALRNYHFDAAECIIDYMKDTYDHRARNSFKIDYLCFYWDMVDGRRDKRGCLKPGCRGYRINGDPADYINKMRGEQWCNSSLIYAAGAADVWAAGPAKIEHVKWFLILGANETYFAILEALEHGNFNIARYIILWLRKYQRQKNTYVELYTNRSKEKEFYLRQEEDYFL